MTVPDTVELLRFAHRLADTARPITLSYFRQPLPVDRKADDSPVTVADRETEEALRTMIGQRFPDHGILGEEHGSEHLDRPYTWVIDPIDGTRAFISGLPLFGTLIGLLQQGEALLGIAEIPALGERWAGVRGQQTTLNDKPCRVSDCRTLRQAALYTTSPDMFQGSDGQRYQQLETTVAMRRFGGDCYCYTLLASGHVDLVVEADLAAYDMLPLVSVIEGAGGVISDWQGKPLSLGSDGRVVAAATRELHQQALEILGA